ncbi:Mis6-domain-containing protein [Mytilinidion resinicola]|uniref:Mis6-domain-containing protein n=1 Tax=Mytilinidion resinicola TaxID=574789 RepID=A0A6A6YRJ1_9PEZI|nr:Mis6-domain-containing protein [Mytilinidion resinicola]KAF2810585.1 Mis6-domain-containing protein [Mytilinidion resinicola]
MPSVASDVPVLSLPDAIEALQRASTTPAKQRRTRVKGAVDAICYHAFDAGLDAVSLDGIVDVVTRQTDLDQTSVTTLIKNLYPAQRVSADVAIRIVGSLGQARTKPTPASQVLLVKWLINTYGVLEDAKVLSRLYGVLFGMLDMISLRTSLCHLLSLITRRKHVRPFRIQQLLELSRGIGNEPALQGLLRVYKDYYPDIIVGTAATTRNSFPPNPTPEWKTRILAIQEAGERSLDGSAEQHNGFRVLRHGSKRSKISLIPEVHTYHAKETSVTLEEIDNVDDFVEKLDRIELPGQMISYLRDPLLQKYLALRPSEIASKRLELWLEACLWDVYESSQLGTGADQRSEIIRGLLNQIRNTKAILPIADEFLKAYLAQWDGISDDDVIVDILGHLPLQPFDDVYKSHLQLAETALIANNPLAHSKLLHLYTNILRNWSTSACTIAPNPPPRSLFPHFTALTTHVSTLSLSILSSTPFPSSPTISAILTFHTILSTSSLENVIPILIPPPHLTHSLLTAPSLATLARFCAILSNLKRKFDEHTPPISAYYPYEMTNTYNGYLMDTCNNLWRSRALLTTDANAKGCFIDDAVRNALNEYVRGIEKGYGVHSSFGFTRSMLFSSLSAAAWRELEGKVLAKRDREQEGTPQGSNQVRHQGPVTNQSLLTLEKSGGIAVNWKLYRLFVVKWLGERGCEGVRDLMFATMSGLKKEESGKLDALIA